MCCFWAGNGGDVPMLEAFCAVRGLGRVEDAAGCAAAMRQVADAVAHLLLAGGCL